jgi:hypothetical protein
VTWLGKVTGTADQSKASITTLTRELNQLAEQRQAITDDLTRGGPFAEERAMLRGPEEQRQAELATEPALRLGQQRARRHVPLAEREVQGPPLSRTMVPVREVEGVPLERLRQGLAIKEMIAAEQRLANVRQEAARNIPLPPEIGAGAERRLAFGEEAERRGIVPPQMGAAEARELQAIDDFDQRVVAAAAALEPYEAGLNAGTGRLLDFAAELGVGKASLADFAETAQDVAQILLRSVLTATIEKPIEGAVSGLFAGLAQSLAVGAVTGATGGTAAPAAGTGPIPLFAGKRAAPCGRLARSWSASAVPRCSSQR